ncbi:hypothetical protein BD413DRAFT_600404 [Trametes elegans]|nr:hypothetical protein BD413DRAFT_600404 [Trametes elegans]
MTTDIELEDLSARPHAAHDPSHTGSEPSSKGEHSRLLVLAVPLILFPRLLLFLSETGEERRVTLTPLESFMALHVGIVLFALAIALVLDVPSSPLEQGPRRGSLGHPLLGPLSGACLLVSFIAYNTTSVGALSTPIFLGAGTIGLWGLWAILFAGSSSISRKTGADKRTSRFLFGNKAAASAQKKQWRKSQGGRH